jgi:quinol monooxygenase YgiN
MNMSPRIVMAVYRPHKGKRDELKTLIDKHVPTLREYELVTERAPLLLEGEDAFVEIFEWVSEDAHDKVQHLPKVAMIWEQMGMVADFIALKDLPEAPAPFAHFTAVEG